MKKRILYCLIVFLCSLCFFVSAQKADEIAIRKILTEQVTAWNKGDIDSFMSGYWKNDSLMYIGKSGVTYGWKNVLNNYKKNYPDTKIMGELTFSLLSIKSLSSQYQNVVGKWHLKREKDDLEGHFTVLFRKINGKWVIVMDHSS